MRRGSLRGAGAAVLGLGLWFLCGAGSGAGDKAGGKALLPEAEFARLVTDDAKAIQTVLAKGTLDKKSGRKVKMAAFMIAVYVQGNMKGAANAAELAGLRDEALKLIKLVDDGNVKEAAAVAAKLAPNAKLAGAKVDPVALEKQLEFEVLMRQFSSERVGGFGIEKELEEVTENKTALTPAQQERLALLGYRMAMIAHVAAAYADEKNEGGKKTKQNWLALTEQFRTGAFGLADAAKGKQEAAIRAALDKVNTSCVKCHDIFR